MPRPKKYSWKHQKHWIGESPYWGLWLIAPWLIGLLALKLVPIIGSEK